MFVVAALYHFAPFENYRDIREPLRSLCDDHKICGSLLLASEGINGTIAGTREGIDHVLRFLRALPGFDELVHKESHASKQPFRRMKVKLKKEIVTMGEPLADPANKVGKYINPADWNDFIARDDVVVIDTRNDYEVAIGSFENAVDPDIKTFREFPLWWRENKERYGNKKVAMFCTGGIRCEKSTSWAIEEGFEEVYHLKGGILKYLEDVPADESQWNGECYVFDGRVSVGHGLKEGPYTSCFACGRPILESDKLRAEFERGVSCHHCVDEYSAERKARFRERQKQIELSQKRGEALGFVE